MHARLMAPSSGPTYPTENSASVTCPSQTENGVLAESVRSHQVMYSSLSGSLVGRREGDRDLSQYFFSISSNKNPVFIVANEVLSGGL